MLHLAHALTGLSILLLSMATTVCWLNRTALQQRALFRGFYTTIASYVSAAGALMVYLVMGMPDYPGTYMTWVLIGLSVALKIALIIGRNRQAEIDNLPLLEILYPGYTEDRKPK